MLQRRHLRRRYVIRPLAGHADKGCALFHGHFTVGDVACHVRTVKKHDAAGSNGALYRAANDNLLGYDVTIYGSVLLYSEMRAANVAIYLTRNLDVAISFQVTDDMEAGIYDSLRRQTALRNRPRTGKAKPGT